MTQMRLEGPAVLIAGANTGIGRVTAREWVLQGAHALLACRSEDKTRPVTEEITALSKGRAKVEYLPLIWEIRVRCTTVRSSFWPVVCHCIC